MLSRNRRCGRRLPLAASQGRRPSTASRRRPRKISRPRRPAHDRIERRRIAQDDRQASAVRSRGTGCRLPADRRDQPGARALRKAARHGVEVRRARARCSALRGPGWKTRGCGMLAWGGRSVALRQPRHDGAEVRAGARVATAEAASCPSRRRGSSTGSPKTWRTGTTPATPAIRSRLVRPLAARCGSWPRPPRWSCRAKSWPSAPAHRSAAARGCAGAGSDRVGLRAARFSSLSSILAGWRSITERVVDRVVEARACQHQAVHDHHGEADGYAGALVRQHAAGGEPCQ